MTKQHPDARRDPPDLSVVIADDATTTHPGRSLDALIAEELEGFAVRRAAFLARNPDERAYLATEDDHTLWQGSKLLAVIRAARGGKPEVTRLDGPGEVDLRTVAFDALALTITRWREAQRRVAELEAAGPSADPSNVWTALAVDQFIDAEQALLLALLATGPKFRDWSIRGALKLHWPARGVVIAGTLFLAIPHPDHEAREAVSQVDVMKLITLPMNQVVDLDD